MTELDEREQLPGHVAVLAPAADLVVVELGVLVPERGGLRILVHTALPAVRGDTPERAAAVEDRDRATELPRDLARRIRGARHAARTTVAPARELRLRRDEIRVATRCQSGAEQGHDDGSDQRADRGARHEAAGAREMERAGVACERC